MLIKIVKMNYIYNNNIYNISIFILYRICSSYIKDIVYASDNSLQVLVWGHAYSLVVEMECNN